jgi:hypothetical protein
MIADEKINGLIKKILLEGENALNKKLEKENKKNHFFFLKMKT